MANRSLPPKSRVRPARDPAAPWAANAAKQRREGNDERAVVYCLTVEGMPLVKIGMTTQLKSRIAKLQSDHGQKLHIAYWAEFHADDARDIERCALFRMRRRYDSEGEWSLAEPAFGAAAIMAAADFMGIAPEYEAGAPEEVETDDSLAELRENKMALSRSQVINQLDRDRYENMHWR